MQILCSFFVFVYLFRLDLVYLTSDCCKTIFFFFYLFIMLIVFYIVYYIDDDSCHVLVCIVLCSVCDISGLSDKDVACAVYLYLCLSIFSLYSLLVIRAVYEK